MKRLTLSLALCLLGSGAMGQAFVCDMNSRGTGGFISERMVISLDPENSEAYVYDGVIAHVQQKPLKVKVLRRSTDAWKLKWNLKDFDLSNGEKTSVKFIATIYPLKQVVTVKGTLGGYDNDIGGRGTCSYYEKED
jgi:hypothetical protein